MDLGLAGKTALVTGSTAGIGFAIAKALADEGAKVIVNGRTQKRVESAIASINHLGTKGVAADFGTAAGAQKVIAAFPDVDLLINNVGIFFAKPYDQLTDEDWLTTFETNVMSGVRLSRHYQPRMVERGFGRILFISSESALQIPAEMIHYGTSKTAQLAVARGLAESVAGTGVTVNSVLPGPTRSEGVGTFVDSLAKEKGITPQEMERQFFKHMRPSSLLKRFETPEEIAHLCAYLCSPLASGTTGAAMRVDGGVVRSIA
jgi:NAD(P)-dependent dehydrogenase (short-subunit alcohol dehydrogenase family)